MIRWTPHALALASLILCAPAFALNGFFAHGYGTQSKAMAGSGVALALDSLAPATNPAAIVWLGARTDIGLSLFNPVRGHSASGEPTGSCASQSQCTFGLGPQNLDSGLELFSVPSFGISKPLSARSAWALSVYGSGGLNTDYDTGSATFGVPSGAVPPGQSVTSPGVFGSGDAGVDLSQLFVVMSYAQRFGTGGAWGVAPILAGERFRAKGLRNFSAYSADPAHLTNNGYDHALGYGVRLGVQGTLHPMLKVGASWQSRVYMSKLDKYAGFFAEQGDLDVPSTFTVGFATTLIPNVTIAFDVQQIQFADVKSVGNRLLPNLMESRLGDDHGVGFGWRNMTVYKLGAAVQGEGNRTWRVGYSYGDQQIPDSQVFLNVLGPSVIRHHLTAGLTQKLPEGREWNVSLMFALRNTVDGPNPLDPAQRIEIEARMFEVEVSYAWGD